jgi:hypothetical protein
MRKLGLKLQPSLQLDFKVVMVTCNLGYFYIIIVIELIAIVASNVLKLYINIYYEKKMQFCAIIL